MLCRTHTSMWSSHTRHINCEDSHKTLKVWYKYISSATVKYRKLLSYECLLNSCFAGTAARIGFHSWVMLRDALLPLTGASPCEAGRREEGGHAKSLRGKMALPESGGSFRKRSVPDILKSSWKVGTHFPWKQWGTMVELIIHCRLKRLLWASWKTSHHLFQFLSNESTSKLLITSLP